MDTLLEEPHQPTALNQGCGSQRSAMRHPCPEVNCLYASSTRSHLKRHLDTVHGPDKLECDACGKKFNTQNRLQTHIAANHVRKCDFCNKTFSSRPHLDRHYLVHTGEKHLKCTICSYRTYQESALKTHMLVHTDEAEFECQECGWKLKSQVRLNQHYKEVHQRPKEIHQCSICSKTFGKISVLRRHLRNHTQEKPYSCSYCSMKFGHAGYLRNHVARHHTGEKPHACKICRKSFVTPGDLRRHENTVHAGEDEKKTYICDFCGRGFPDTNHWRRHLNRHTGEKTYACTVCGRTFNCSSNMSRHMRVHTGEKPHGCTICDKKFRTTQDVKDHINRHHTGEKPYLCTDCGKRFLCSPELIAHKRTHVGESRKMWACKFCDKKFTTPWSRDQHHRRHRDEKLYKCELCNFAVVNKGGLTRHQKTLGHLRKVYKGSIYDCRVVLTRLHI